MTSLLSDEELALEKALVEYRTTVIAIHEGKSKGVDIKAATDKLVHLINTQKRLYAESVIGEDVVVSGKYPIEEWKRERATIINAHLAEQRRRIK